MKKAILFFVCITALTIVNFIKIENKAELKTSLSSLLVFAKAYGESGSPCYEQLYDIDYIGEPCDYMTVERFECQGGTMVYNCARGFYTTNYYCQGPSPIWNDGRTWSQCP